MKNLILVFSLFLLGNQILISQTLIAGDMAVIGVNEDAGPTSGQDHSFAIIALKDIPEDEIVYFTEQGWNDDGSDTPQGFWIGNTEGHFSWIAPAGGISCGTVLRFYETGSNIMNVEGGGTVSGILSGSGWSLSGGDQIIAYYSSSGARPVGVIPVFITALHMDDGLSPSIGYNSSTTWSMIASGTASSHVPPGLTNGDNCIALFNPNNALYYEQDNAKYTGTLTGNAATLRGLINTSIQSGGLWSTHNSTPFNITPAAFTTAVDCAVLPVELLQFTVQFHDNYALLEWETASEINNQGFDIEYSKDGNNWKKIGYQKGKGSTDLYNSYSFNDKKPKLGVNYYRLKQIDFDGSYEYSNIQSVRIEEKNAGYSIFPNPSYENEVSIIIPNDGTTMSIFNNNGRLLYVSKLEVGLQQISLEAFSEGLYFVKFVNEGQVTLERLVIDN